MGWWTFRVLRDPAHPFDSQSQPAATEPAIVWIDLHVPRDAPPGDYAITCQARAADGDAGGYRCMFSILRFRRTAIC